MMDILFQLFLSVSSDNSQTDWLAVAMTIKGRCGLAILVGLNFIVHFKENMFGQGKNHVIVEEYVICRHRGHYFL
jgi:hypothetical protein